MKLFLKIPYYLFIALVAVVGVLLLATLMPVPGNFKVKIVESGSMEPAIKTGGIIVIKPADSYNLEEVVTFGPDTKTQVPTTHRIVKIEGEGASKIFTTKGDANNAPDPASIRLSDIGGKVVFSLPYLGFILDFARKPLGFLLIVGMPAILVIVDEFIKILREIKKIRLRKNKTQQLGKEESEYAGRINILDLRVKPMAKPKSSKFYPRAFLTVVALIGAVFGVSSTGSTVSYYNEHEFSTGNILRAGTNFPQPLRMMSAGISDADIPSPEILSSVDEKITEPDVSIGSEESLLAEEEKPITKDELLAETEEQQPEEKSGEQDAETAEQNQEETAKEEVASPEAISSELSGDIVQEPNPEQ
jgi:signal peptidase I